MESEQADNREGKDDFLNSQKQLWKPVPLPELLLIRARKHRSQATNAEEILWNCLRNKQMQGFKFRRQHPMERYILDFYCVLAKLAIELDGSAHSTEVAKSKDEERTIRLEKLGIKLLRFWNDEITENLEGVLQAIWNALQLSEFRSHPDTASLEEGTED